MNLGIRAIDQYLTFPANTHAVDSGAATDADGDPAYRIYEDETGTAILTGTMSKLDDANTTGFYTERIQLTAANGFEVTKSYTIYISAAVGAITGTMSHTFQVEAIQANLTSILADTNELQTDLVNGGRLDLLIDAILADTNELQTDWVNDGRLDLLIDAILADTNELQAEFVNGGRLDLLIDAIKAKTDLLIASQTGCIDANVKKFRDIDVPATPFPA